MGYKEQIDVFEQTDLLVDLRFGDGLNAKEYEKLVKALTIFTSEWESRNSIPKKAVFALFDLYGDMYHYSFRYADEESARILKAAEIIKKLINRCTEQKGEIDPEKSKVIARLCEYINADGNFFEKLQRGKGMDEQQFEKIYTELNSISDEIYSWELFPKELATIFIDLYELSLFVYRYEGEFNQHEEADKINEAYDHMFSLIFG